MLTGGYIKIHRKIIDWEWYHDPVVSRVFLHLLVTANYEPGRFEGHKIEVGQCVISLQKVAEILNVSKDSVNRALKKLEKSGELQRLPTAKFTIITLKNYTHYQQSATEAIRLPSACHPQADPMEEIKKARKQESKKEEGGASAPASPSPSPQITFDSLILDFGKSNVDAYTIKARNWMRRKGIKGEPTAELVGKWLNEDRDKLKLPGDDKSNIAVSFDIDELEKSSYARYRKDKNGKK